MEERFFENDVEVLETLVLALGAGLGVWGTINLTEAYKAEAEKDEITAEYRARISEIDGLIMQLYADKKTGKISNTRYMKLAAGYEAEQTELIEALYSFDKEIAAQKKQAMTQIMKGGSLVLIAPLVGSPEDMQYALDFMDRKQRENGYMPV